MEENNLPDYVETVIGSDITIENSNGDIINGLNIGGDSQQNGTPSQANPQEIKVVKGINNLLKNVVVDSGDGNYWSRYSSFDEDAGTGEITSINATTNESFIVHQIKNIKSGKTYTLSCLAKSNGYVIDMDLYCYNSSTQGVVSKRHINLTNEFQKYTWTFTTNSSVDYSNAVIRFDNNGSTVSGTEAILTVKDVMLEESNTAHEYVPYGSWFKIKANNSDTFNEEYLIKADNIELCKVAIFRDYIFKENEKWYLRKQCGKIDSYNGETITTEYISTTGALTTGATVYYRLSETVLTEITDSELIGQLETLNNMHLPYGTVHIQTFGDLPPILGIGYNNWNKDISPSDRQALIDGTATIETKLMYDKTITEELEYRVFDTYTDGNTTIALKYVEVDKNTEYLLQTQKTNGYIYLMVLKDLPKNMEDFENNITDYLAISFPYYFELPLNDNGVSFETNDNSKYIMVMPFVDNTPYVYDGIKILKQTRPVLTQDNSIISWNHEDFRYVKDQGWIGQFVARQVTGELKNINDEFNITDSEFELQIGVKTNDNTNWYSLGNFMVTKVSDDEVNDKTSFEALDYTKKFNKTYEDRMTYPCTAGELAQDVCDQCGVTLATEYFKNHDYIINGNVFTNNESCRDVMKAIGKLAFSWVRVDWDNKVYLDFEQQSQILNENEINNSKYYNLKTQKDVFGPVNRIIIGYSQIEGERTKIEDLESIEQNGLCELTIYDNPLVYTQEQRESIIQSASDLLGLTYTPFNATTVGHPWLKGKEKIEVIDMENISHETMAFDRTIQYFGHIKTVLDTASQTKTNTEYAYDDSLDKSVMQTEITVNKINGDIKSLTSKMSVIEGEVNNTYTIEQVNELVQNAQTGLTNTFSESGGNNIFRNTGLWFEQNDINNPYEYWNGNVEQIKEEKASNIRGLLLKQGNLSQEQIVNNGNYTVSFKYKKQIPLSTVKCYINDIEYELTETNDTEFTQTFEVTSQHINVRFNSDIDDACEIYDLMVNAGTTKLVYSQNQNETTTDTVNISKGITITSTDTETIFKANADGIRTLDRNNNELTKFTDTGMRTKEMVVESTSQIVGVLVQQVGDQTWFTRL